MNNIEKQFLNATDGDMLEFIREFKIPELLVPPIESDKEYYDEGEYDNIRRVGWFADCNGRIMISLPYGNNPLLIGQRYSEEKDQWVAMTRKTPVEFSGRIKKKELIELKLFLREHYVGYK